MIEKFPKIKTKINSERANYNSRSLINKENKSKSKGKTNFKALSPVPNGANVTPITPTFNVIPLILSAKKANIINKEENNLKVRNISKILRKNHIS